MPPNAYPDHLIPNKDLKIIDNAEIDQSEHLGIWVRDDLTFKDPDGRLSQSAIDLSKIPSFSTNKIPDSVPNDLNIFFERDFISIYNVAWHEGEDGTIPENSHFSFVENRNHYFIKISNIDNFGDHYQNPPTDDSIQYEFIVHVVHKPLVSNYWHFELSITSPDHVIIDTKGAWKKLICSSIRKQIQEKAEFSI